MPVPTSLVEDQSAVASSSQKNIWVAAGEGDIERVRHLVEVEGLSPISPDQWTYTPLHAAASYGQIEVLRYLLGHNSAPASAIETTDEDGDTPLFAVEDVETARILVEEFGADAKRENSAGDTPAANAEENERPEVAAYFRSLTGEAPMYASGTDVEAQDDDLAINPALDGEIDQRTDVLMERVQEILSRAQSRGANSGEELTEEEEEELRRVVGESLFTQIREGWNSSADGEVTTGGSEGVAAVTSESTIEEGSEDDSTPNPMR
ncbi:hypothetical protein CBS101457_003261 [Exobasidium rhododendri]|nr:hypothetical protein CBS101457_003261 [Exobasidium rhododendri]